MRLNTDWVERLVRLLVGLPIVTAYLYVRHLSTSWAYACLVIGISLMIASILRKGSFAWTRQTAAENYKPSDHVIDYGHAA